MSTIKSQTLPEQCLPLPLVPEDITAEWPSHVLGHKFSAFEATETILLATAAKVFLTLEYEDGKKRKKKKEEVCVKCGCNRELMAKCTPMFYNIYCTEAMFFAMIAPSLDKMDLPKVLWAGSDEEQAMLVMEDLRTGGNRFVTAGEAWTVVMCMAGVEQLAVLHAGTWGAAKEDYPCLKTDYDGL